MFYSVLAALAMAASAPPAPPPADTVVRDGVEVAILPRLTGAGLPDSVVEAGLDVEARTDEAARRLGFRSMSGVAEFDCRLGKDRFVEARAYDSANLGGAAVARPISPDWSQPADGSVMAAVAARVCAAAGAAAPPGPAPLVTAGAAADAVPAASGAPPAAAPPARAPAAPEPPAPAAGHSIQAEAQVAASPSAKDARKLLADLQALIQPPLAAHIEPAQVKGAQVFRVSIDGFASLEDARAFCASLAGKAPGCWVRPAKPPPPRPPAAAQPQVRPPPRPPPPRSPRSP